MKSPVTDQKSFSASAPSSLWGWMEMRVRLILLEQFLVLLLVLEDPGSTWMFSDVDILQRS